METNLSEAGAALCCLDQGRHPIGQQRYAE
jgi:hypothetical protein